MPKYQNNQEYREARPNPVAEGIVRGVEEARQIQARRSAEATLNDPNASPIQKAIAASRIDPKITQDILKYASKEKQRADIRARYGQGQGDVAKRVPNVSELQQQLANMQGNEDLQWLQNYQPGQPTRQPNQPMATQPPQNNVQPNMGRGGLPFSEPEILEATLDNPAESRAMTEINKSVQREQLAAKKQAHDEKIAAKNENKKFRERMLDGIKASKKMAFQLDEMEQLNEEGIEISPLGYKALQVAGIPLSGFFDAPNAEALEKLANDTTTAAIRDYGSKLYASEFNTFLKRIPTLWLSQEGRRRVIKTMRMYNDLERTEQEAYLTLYNAAKQQGDKDPVVRQEDVIQFADERENQIIQALNTELARERQIRDIGEVSSDKLLMRFPDGQILPVPKKDLVEAVQMGGLPQ